MNYSAAAGDAMQPGNTTHYYYGDHLGSGRVMTAGGGWPVWQATYLPFGYEYNPQNPVSNFKFTGQERDTESGLDHFWFRQYNSTAARWISPDPAGLAAVDLTNPQSLNRYAYVMNTPTVYVDPLGLQVARLPDPEGGGRSDPFGGLRCYDVGNGIDIPCADVFSGGYNIALTQQWVPGSGVPAGCLGNAPENPTVVVCVPANLSAPPPTPANNADPTLDNRANELAAAINRTGVQTMANPCTYVGWTAAAATLGAGGAAVANHAEIEAAVVNNAPTLVTRVLNWWFNLTSRPGRPGFVRAVAATAVAAKDAVVTTCKQF